MARPDYSELTPAQLVEASMALRGEFVRRLDLLETSFNLLVTQDELPSITLPTQSLPPVTQRLVRMVMIETDTDKKVVVTLEKKPTRYVMGRGFILSWMQRIGYPNNLGLAIQFKEARERSGINMFNAEIGYCTSSRIQYHLTFVKFGKICGMKGN